MNDTQAVAFEHPFHDPQHPRHREFIEQFCRLGCVAEIAPDEDNPNRLRRPPTVTQIIARMEREGPPTPAPAADPEITFNARRR